jgi:hypothetical protein
MSGMSRSERFALWLSRTGLPPPEERGFVPRREGDERPARIDREYERRLQELTKQAEGMSNGCKDSYQEPYPHHPKWSIGDPSWRNNSDPGWENVVRAIEESRVW